jgi:tetratricopeptide (TPR) repeat protein
VSCESGNALASGVATRRRVLAPVTEEQIWRASRRITYLPYVALTLNNLGFLDKAQNRMEDARQRYDEALKIYRQLVRRNPDMPICPLRPGP